MLVAVALGLLPAVSRNSGPRSGTVFASRLERCGFCKFTWLGCRHPAPDQFNRHLCVARENLVEQGGYGSQVINDDDGNAHIGRQMPQ